LQLPYFKNGEFMMRFGHNLKTLDAVIKYVGTADGDSTATIIRIKDRITHKKE